MTGEILWEDKWFGINGFHLFCFIAKRSLRQNTKYQMGNTIPYCCLELIHHLHHPALALQILMQVGCGIS